MPRLFIIDQFLRDYQGHNFGYSMAVAEAGRETGLDPVIVANRALRVRTDGAAGRVLAWFDHPGHGGGTPRRRERRPLRAAVEQLLVLASRRHAAFRHLWAAWSHPRVVPNRDRGPTPPWAWAEPVRALGRTVRDLWAARRGRAPDLARRFAIQCGALLGTQRIGPADHVFLHTVTFAELAALRDELALRSPQDLPRIHIVLRNDPDLDPPAYDLGRCLEGFRAAGLWPGRVTFYCDTPELVRLYERFSTVRFHEIPIPLWHAGGEERAAAPADRPLHVVYLGDARPEKGYQHLPALVQDLWPDLIRTGRVRLTIQSNFNMPGGEPGIAEARNLLLQFPDDRVRVLADPLADDAYRVLLADADLLVLPYDAERYRARSSGVAAEALALGKPIVAPARTWLAAHAPAGAVETFARPDGFPAAVRAAVARHAAMTAAARAAAGGWRERHSAAALVRTLLEERAAADAVAAPGPAVLYIMDADAFIFRTGSSSVARNQIDHLSRSGFRVFGVFLSMDVANPAFDEQRWRDELEKALPPGVFSRVWLLGYRPPLSGFRQGMRLLESIRRRDYSFDRSEAMYDGLAIPEDLRRFARTAPPDGILMNYVAAWRLVERLGLSHRPVLCETHDIQAFQHAHYGRRPVDPREFERECAMLDRCAGVITLNELEADKVRPHLRQAALFDIRPLIDTAPATVGDLAGFPDLGALLRACGLEPGRDAVAGRLAQESHIDLLYVSTGHWPNIVSFRWFYESVYLPHLAERGVTLVVAGNIDRMLPDVVHPRTFLTGRVDDLRPLYAATRLVVLPMRMGAGFNIKTMEALAFGKAVVATRFAMRSLNYDAQRFPTDDDPDGFAARICTLLDDPAARAEAAARALAVARANNRPDRYDAAMNEAYRGAWGAHMPQAPERRPPPPVGEPCEWSMAVQCFNRYARGVDGASADELRGVLADPANWTTAAALHRALGGGGDFAGYARDRLGIAAPPSSLPAEVVRIQSARFIGCVEGVADGCVVGWLIDRRTRGLPAEVEILEHGRVVACATAGLARPDLKRMELGNGGHGFRHRLPAELFDGQEHTLVLRPRGLDIALAGSPVTVRLDREDWVSGHVDGIADGCVCGWAWDALAPDTRLTVAVRVGDAVVARGCADLPRADLAAAGVGDGRHAFQLPLPDHLLDGGPLAIEVVPEPFRRALPGTPGRRLPAARQAAEVRSGSGAGR